MSTISETFEIAARDKSFTADCKAKGEVLPSRSQKSLERCIWASAYSGYVLGKYGPEYARELMLARRAGAEISFDETGKPVAGPAPEAKVPWWRFRGGPWK